MTTYLTPIDTFLASKYDDKEVFVYDESSNIVENTLNGLVEAAIHLAVDSLPHNARTYQYTKYLETACAQHPEARHGDNWIEYEGVRIEFTLGSRCILANVNGKSFDITLLDFECVTMLPAIMSYAKSRVETVFHTGDRLAVEQQWREEERRAEQERARVDALCRWGGSLYGKMYSLIHPHEWRNTTDAANETCTALMQCNILKAEAMGKGLEEEYAQRALLDAGGSYIESMLKYLDRHLEWKVEACVADGMDKQEVYDDFMDAMSPVVESMPYAVPAAETYWKEFWKKCSARVRARVRAKERAEMEQIQENEFIQAINSPRFRHITSRGWDNVHKWPVYGRNFYHLVFYLKTGQQILFRHNGGSYRISLLETASRIIPLLDRLAEASSARIRTKHPVSYVGSPAPASFEDPAIRAMAEIICAHTLPMKISESKSRIELSYYFSSTSTTAMICVKFRKPSSVAEAESLARLFVEYAEADHRLRSREEGGDPCLIYELYA